MSARAQSERSRRYKAKLESVRPDLARYVQQGALTLRAACIEAGILRASTRPDRLRSIWKVCSKAERKEFLNEILAMYVADFVRILDTVQSSDSYEVIEARLQSMAINEEPTAHVQRR